MICQTEEVRLLPLPLHLVVCRQPLLWDVLKDYDPGNPQRGRIKAEAGMRYMADQGFKTEGEFNHDTNKKAVIDEENGEKEAELTGGELVFVQTSLERWKS